MKTNGTRRRRKAKTGSVTIRSSNNRPQLVFTHLSKRHFVSLGLPNTPLNLKTAQDIAFDVQRDIQYGEFDPTYRKYKIHSTGSATDPLGKGAQQGSRLMALWDHYVDYLTLDASPKTINGTYNPVRAHIGRSKTDGLIDPLKFRQELLKSPPDHRRVAP